MSAVFSSSGPRIPWILLPMVRLLQWSRASLEGVSGQSRWSHGSLDAGGAFLLVGAITMAALVGVPLLLTVGGGIGIAVLFVVARTWLTVQERSHA